MARKTDSGWRDGVLAKWHADNGFDCPAAGMTLPMIEYDRGQSVGLVNYIPRGNEMPSGEAVAATYRAFGNLHNDIGGRGLPFLTAVYDPRSWAMKLFPHNPAAVALTGSESGWQTVTEAHFARILFMMRGRSLPDMFGYGVEWSNAPWSPVERVSARGNLPFACADMSARRRQYEPAVSAPMRTKVPCLDIDVAIVDRDDRLALVVDYKRHNAACDVDGTNATALASLAHPTGAPVPALMTRYHTDGDGWWFETYPLNRSASRHLAYVIGAIGAPVEMLTDVVVGGRWIRLTESHWRDVLRVARDL